MTEPINVEKPVKHENTIFKSSYHYGRKLCQFFFNYNVGGHGSYSLILKGGPITLIHNIDKDHKLSFAKAVIKQLSKEELEQILKEGA